MLNLPVGVLMTSWIPPAAMRRYGEELLALVAGQEDVPEADLPAPLPKPLDARQRDQVKTLKSRGRDIAAELGTAPEILLQGADYELLVRLAEGEDGIAPAHWQGWRRDRVIEPLRQVLRA